MNDETEISLTIQQLQTLIKSNKITQGERRFLQYVLSLRKKTSNTTQKYQQLSPHYKNVFSNQSLLKRNEAAYSQYCNIRERIKLYVSRKKVMLRKQGSDEKWMSYFIQCDFYQLYFFKDQNDESFWRKITIQNVWISKNWKKSKKQYAFNLVHHKKIYEIGLKEKTQCEQLHLILINLLRKKRERKNNDQIVEQIEKPIQNSNQINKIQELKQNIVANNKFKEQIDNQGFESQCRQLISKYNRLNDLQYNLHHNIQNGKYTISQNYLKLSYFTSSQQSNTFAQSYISMHKWNTLIDQFKFQTKQQSVGLIYATILLKQFNFMTYQRSSRLKIIYLSQFLVNIQKQLSQDNTAKSIKYIFIISKPSTSDSKTVYMNIQQYIQITQLQEGGLFVNIISLLEYHSYKVIAKDIQVNLAFCKDISAINNVCNQMRFSHQQKNVINPYQLCQYKEKNKTEVVFSQSPFMQEQKYHQQLQLIYQYYKNIKNQSLIKFIGNRINEKYYINHKFIDKPYQKSPTSRQIIDFLFRGGRWKLKNGNFVFSDQQCLSQQKGLIKKLIKKIGSNIMSGKSVMNVSLPVQIFSTKSALQAFCEGLGFFPTFIKKAIECSEITQQIKYISMCYFFKYACNSHILKPFNPILGQTFQCIIGDIPFYFEQISHHPPIASLYVKTDYFQSYGNYDLVIQVGLNVAYFKFHSLLVIKIPKTNSEYYIKVPNLEVGGVMLGDRSIKLVGKGFVLQKNSNTLCELSIGKERKGLYTYNTKLQDSDLAGGIFKISKTQSQRILELDRTKSFEGVKIQQIAKSYSKISGKWYGDMHFDNIAYKTVVGGPFPLQLQRPPFLLPSDSLFRKDICYKKWGDNDTSNIQKELLEDQQRNDKKLRQKYLKK